MAGILCKQCGYENPEGSEICEICAEPLTAVSPAVTEAPQPIQQTAPQNPSPVGVQYYVMCPESNTKTFLADGNVKKFFCEGCKIEHEIDDFLWTIETAEAGEAAEVPAEAAAPKEDRLWLEEVNSHFRIDIEKTGGTLGRYGTFGAQFFQSRNLLMVSGEHCAISYEYGSWVLRHVSRTNQTKYNGAVLEANQPNLLQDGKILTLADAVSFVVRIG